MNIHLKICLIGAVFFAKSAHGQVAWKEGITRELPEWFFGVNGNMGTVNLPWDNARNIESFKQLGARSIRYPAGTIANTWDWDKGWMDDKVADSLLIDWVVSQGWKTAPVRYPLSNFKKAIDASGAMPVYVLNMLSKDLEHSLRGLRQAKALGLPVRFIEMGNELYFNLKLEVGRYPTPEDYGKTCFAWIKAIKQEFPEAKCAVVSWEAVRSERHKNWTERVLKYATNADAVVFHVYTPFGLGGGRERVNNQAGQEGLTSGDSLSKDPAVRQQQELTLLQQPAVWEQVLHTADEAALRYKAMRVPMDKAIWATEFNVRADNSAIRGTWGNTLFIFRFYQHFLASPQIQMTHYHNIQGIPFGAYFSNQDGFRHLKTVHMKSTPGALTAGGMALHLLANASAGANRATAIHLATTDDAQSKNLGWLLEGTDKKMLLINDSEKPVRLIAGKLAGSKGTIYRAGLTHYVNGWEGIEIMSEVAKNDLTLPPFSVSIWQVN